MNAGEHRRETASVSRPDALVGVATAGGRCSRDQRRCRRLSRQAVSSRSIARPRPSSDPPRQWSCVGRVGLRRRCSRYAKQQRHGERKTDRSDRLRVPGTRLPDAQDGPGSFTYGTREHVYAQDLDRDSNTIGVFVGRLRRGPMMVCSWISPSPGWSAGTARLMIPQ